MLQIPLLIHTLVAAAAFRCLINSKYKTGQTLLENGKRMRENNASEYLLHKHLNCVWSNADDH